MNDFLLLIKVSRPYGWVIAPLIFFTGISVAGTTLGLMSAMHLLLLSFPFSLFTFGINDIYDYETDKRSPRKPSREGFLLERKHYRFVKKSAVSSAAILILFPLLSKNALTIISSFALVFLAYSYSAPPIRFKTRPIIDSFSNVFGLWLLLLLGFSYGGSFHQFPEKLYYASLIAASFHAIGAVMDYSSDKKAGVRTIATFFGKRFAALFAALMAAIILLLSGIISPALNAYFLMALLIALISMAFPYEKFVRQLFLISFVAFIASILAFLYQQFLSTLKW